MACKRDIKVLLIDKVAELSKTNSISKVNTMFGTEVIKPSGRIFIPSSLIDTYWNKYNEVKNKPVTPKRREISLTPNIKPGVAELFDSNPELANAVYEALGFSNNVTLETERGSVYYLNDGKTKRDKKTLTGRIEKFSESDKTVYITEENFKILRENSEGLSDLEWTDNDVTVTNDSGRKTTISISNTPKIGLLPLELVKGVDETESGYREDKRINIKSYSFLPKGVSFHVGHKIVSINKQITPQQKQQSLQLYSQYLEQNPNGSVEQFKSWVEEFNNKSKIQGAYDFSATSNSGKWNSANNELFSLVQDNRKAFAIYKFLIGDMQTFKEIVDFLNEKGIEIPYTDRMKRADETMTTEEKQSAIDSYNNSVSEKTNNKSQVEKDILSENNLQDETEYTPQELIEKYPLTGVQKVIWNLIKDIVNKLGIKVKFSSSRITEGFDGSNNPLNGEILIRPSTLKNGRFGEVLVHEVVHSLTTKIISRVNSGVTTGLTQKQINAVKGLMKLFEAVKADNNLENKYPVKDVFEFIAHLTNEAFVKELESKDKNFLQKVVDFILDILGINNANELSKKYLIDIISDGTFLEENGITVLPSDYGNNLQGSLSDFISQKSQDFQSFQQSLNKPNTNSVLQGNQQEQVKKFAELQERLSNKEFLEGAKGAWESTPALQQLGTQEEYNDYIARVSLGIIKNPSNEEYNYTSQVKDIVYHGTNVKFDKFDKSFINQSFENLLYFFKNKVNALNWKGETSFTISKSKLIQDINSLNTSIKEASIEDNLLYALTQHFRVNSLIELSDRVSKYDFEKINNILNYTGLNKYDLYNLYKNDIENYRKTVKDVLNNLSEEIKIDNNRVISAIINVQNPLVLEERYHYYLGTEKGKEFKRKVNKDIQNKDGLIANEVVEYENDEIKNIDTQYAVKEPEQIHILGSKQDIEGFKQFVSGRKNQFQKNRNIDKDLAQKIQDKLQRLYPANKDMEMKMLPDDIKGEYDIFLDELNDSDVNPIFKGTQGETLVDENNNLCALK